VTKKQKNRCPFFLQQCMLQVSVGHMLEQLSTPALTSNRPKRAINRDMLSGADISRKEFKTGRSWIFWLDRRRGLLLRAPQQCSATRLGWQVRPEFVVPQGGRAVLAL